MSLRLRVASFLSLTQTDVTVALVIASAALVGWGYTTFFDDRDPARVRHDITALLQRHDSIQTAHQAAQLRRNILSDTANSDSLVAWNPLSDGDIAADSMIASSAASRSSSGKKQPPSEPININTAPKAELMRLPGVGEKTAEGIMEYRHGQKFNTPADIMKVKGIGQKKYDKMRQFLKVK